MIVKFFFKKGFLRMKTIKKEGISKILKGTIVDYLSSSTIHGFSRIVGSTNIIQRLIWIILAFAASGYSFYIIRNYFVEYFDYPTVTKIEIRNEPMPDFPVVRICNFNFNDIILINLSYNNSHI